MSIAPFTIVRFALAESTLHAALSSGPEARRALRSIAWGSRETEAGEVLVTPPALPARAADLRKVLAAIDGLTEIDATGEYTLGYSTSPEAYDSFGTMTVSADGEERLVAIRNEHVEWQVGRYASGLHGFRRLSPPPPPEPEGAREQLAPPAPTSIEVGAVVHFSGRVRRFVVVRVETFDSQPCLSMVALSGALAGSYPTVVPLAEVERDADQTVAFSGAAAGALRRKYEQARRGGLQLCLEASHAEPSSTPTPPETPA
jgi:hypothetical protein